VLEYLHVSDECLLFLRFSFCSTRARDWLRRMSLKGPILCRVGHKTLTQSQSISLCLHNTTFTFSLLHIVGTNTVAYGRHLIGFSTSLLKSSCQIRHHIFALIGPCSASNTGTTHGSTCSFSIRLFVTNLSHKEGHVIAVT